MQITFTIFKEFKEFIVLQYRISLSATENITQQYTNFSAALSALKIQLEVQSAAVHCVLKFIPWSRIALD